MQLHDEIAPRLETPLRAGWDGMRRLAGRPAEQLPLRIARVAFHAALVSRRRIAHIEVARRASAIDADVGVVHDTGVAGTEFESANVAWRRHRERDDERAEHIAALGGNDERMGHAHDESRGSELPAVIPAGSRRQIGGVALGHAAGHPSLNHIAFPTRQPAFVLEYAVAFRFPRRHDPARGHRRNEGGAPPHVVVGEEAERPDFTRPVAGRAPRPDDRRDILVERRYRLRRRGKRRTRDQRKRYCRRFQERQPCRSFIAACRRRPRHGNAMATPGAPPQSPEAAVQGDHCASITLLFERKTRPPHIDVAPNPPPPAAALGAGAALAIFTVALAVRLVHVWQIRRAPFFSVLMGDSRGYDEWAKRIAGGEWLGHEVSSQAPLYPYLLGVIYAVGGRNLLLVRLVQITIGSLSCALLGVAAARLFSRRIGVAAGVMLALYAPAIFFDGLLQKSVLDVFFVCLALALMTRIAAPTTIDGASEQAEYSWLRRRFGPSGPWLLLGLTMGGLALTRENALVLIVVILAWALARSTGSRPSRASGRREVLERRVTNPAATRESRGSRASGIREVLEPRTPNPT